MAEYRYLCPQCGKAFEEGTPATVCPDCQVLLRSTGGITGALPADAGLHLPAHLDIGKLMQSVLAEQPQEQELDETMRRVLRQRHPEIADALFRPLAEILSTQQRMWGLSRLEAARRMAEGVSEMHLSPEGKPEISSFYFQGSGLDELTPAMREQVLHLVGEAARTGQPMCKKLVLKPPRQSLQSRITVLLPILTALVLAAFYCLGRFLAGK
jgi:hypothetical protein